MKKIIVFAHLLSMFALNASSASILYVNINASGNNNGNSWKNAYINLQSALDVVKPGDQVWVARGVYLPTKNHGGDSQRNKSFLMINQVNIYGGFNGAESQIIERDWINNKTFLSGDIGIVGDSSDNCFHVIYNNSDLDSTTSLDGFIIKDGNADGINPDNKGGAMINWGNIKAKIINCTFSNNVSTEEGGAIYNNHCKPIILKCHFIQNNSLSGGAISISDGGAKIEGCSFEDNSAISGGAIFTTKASITYINSSTFNNNTGKNGGAIYLHLPDNFAYINQCSFSNNFALESAGAIITDWSNVTIIQSIFNDNKSNSFGGAISSSMSTPNIINCLFNNNSSKIGGAISLHYYSYTNIINSTFANNSATSDGGAFYSDDRCHEASIFNSIIWENSALVDGNQIKGLSNYILTNTLIANKPGDIVGSIQYTNCLYSDPKLVNPAKNDYRIFGDSPCVDSGDTSKVSELFDIRGVGFARKISKNGTYSGLVDIGAYEYQVGIDPPSSINNVEIFNLKVDGLSIYPLPSHGQVNIQAGFNSDLLTFSLYNNLGEKVAVSENLSVTNSIFSKKFDFSHLNNGIYYFILTDGIRYLQSNLIISK